MKKGNKSRISLVIISVAIISIGSFVGLSVKADKPNLSSKGNYVFEDGTKAAFYADDIYYLHSEIAKLFNEIQNQRGE